MSTFISYNNQTILWNTIQKVPLLQQKIQKEYQANWFRQIIEDIYTQNQYRNLNVQELNELNKQTISYMINSLKKSNNENNQTTSIENLDYQDTNTEFSKREKEYEILKNNTKMNEKPNFNQTIEDKAIDNMDELLYNQQIQRDLDLQAVEIKDLQKPKNVTWDENLEDSMQPIINRMTKLEKIVENLTGIINKLLERKLDNQITNSLENIITKIELSES
tara:strand:+ start:14263 stop:14922 length:660 start_codon:yes stop_codon:yes gene_type:complete